MSLRLFLYVLQTEAKKSLSYRVDFWITVIGGFLVGVAVPYFMWVSIFHDMPERLAGDAAPELGGFTLIGMIVYYVAAVLVGTVVRGNDLPLTTATDIYEGGLNRYLVYPTHYFPFKFAQQLGALAPALAQLVLLGGAALAWAHWGAGVELGTIGLTPSSVAMGIVSIFAANFLYFCMAYPLQLVAFWADNVWSLLVLLRFSTALLGGALLPLALFPDTYRAWIDYTPFPALFAVPIETLLGRVSLQEWLVQLGVAGLWSIIILGATRSIWARGRRQYTGIGI